MKLTDNTVLITGGTSGIGRALAIKLSQHNQIVVTSRGKKHFDKQLKNNSHIAFYPVDVSDTSSVSKLKDWVEKNYPKLNLVINSAGIMLPFNLLDEKVTPKELKSEINTNLFGTINVDKTFLNLLRAQDEAMLVNICSGLNYFGAASNPIYSVAEAGIHMFVKLLREQLEYAGQNQVHVMELVPPLVAETNLDKVVPASTLGNLSLADLVKDTLAGMSKNAHRVNAGAAKEFAKMAHNNPDKATSDYAKQILPVYFPKGLL